VKAAWGAEAAAEIAAAHAEAPPLDLTLRDPGEASHWAGRLDATVLETGSLRLAARAQVSALPGFAEGAWWVQDAAAALPARMLGPVAGERVLDLGAAPGGKTLQLAAAGATVTALDVSGPRLRRLKENLARTGLAAAVVEADALGWTPGEPYDAIMLDAPCSASGTIRRHPDLPHLRSGTDLGPLLALQAALLDRAWGWLRPGGRLVFATCSLLPSEGEDQVAAFLARTPHARRLRPSLALPEGWLDGDGALRTRPDFWAGRGGIDGFHAAALAKAEA
jgi:16S rRNA (cytosine967-C5)-methyltransferase